MMNARSFGFASAQVLYLFAPLLVSAAVSAVVSRFQLWRALYRPIDGGRTWRRRRLFGNNKTWREVLVVVLGSTVTVSIQKLALGNRVASSRPRIRSRELDLVRRSDRSRSRGLELPNSFVKRQLGIAPSGTATGISVAPRSTSGLRSIC